jgi:hypothetical protein
MYRLGEFKNILGMISDQKIDLLSLKKKSSTYSIYNRLNSLSKAISIPKWNIGAQTILPIIYYHKNEST